jgi:hypothetical protein
VNVIDPLSVPTFAIACGTPPALAPGSRHTFLYCFNVTGPSTGTMQVYVDGVALPGASTPVPTTLFPRLDFPTSFFGPDVISNTVNLRIHRVFACSTSNVANCR